MIICPQCESSRLTNVRGDKGAGVERWRVGFDGHPLRYWVSHWKCEDCGNRFEITQRMDSQKSIGEGDHDSSG